MLAQADHEGVRPGAAGRAVPVWRRSRRCATVQSLAPSSSGLGRRPLKAVAPVQIRAGRLTEQEVTGPVITRGDRALIIGSSFADYGQAIDPDGQSGWQPVAGAQGRRPCRRLALRSPKRGVAVTCKRGLPRTGTRWVQEG